MSTIKDVAARAGVSFTTVSHVLNGTRRVSDAARLRVHQAVQELGYVPSALARALKTDRTRTLGVLVPNLTNPYFAELTRGIEDACRRAGYALILCCGDDDPEQQSHNVHALMQRRIDGLLLAVPAGEAGALARALASVRQPLVLVDRTLPYPGADLVRVDHRAGARLAVQHLLSLGHRRIACLAGPPQFEVSRARVAGWRDALMRAGIAMAPEWLCTGDFSSAAGHTLTHALLARTEISALFATNDLLALGALRAAAERGVAVPRQLSIIGFDGIELGQYVHPALSTVGTPIRVLGERAVGVLVDRIAKPRARGRELVLAPALLLRESTGPAPRAGLATVHTSVRTARLQGR